MIPMFRCSAPIKCGLGFIIKIKMCCVMNRCVLKILSFKDCLVYQNSFLQIPKSQPGYVSYMFLNFFAFCAFMFHKNMLKKTCSTLVSDSNTYIWISNRIQMFESYSNVRIYIQMLKECVFTICSWKMVGGRWVKKDKFCVT